MAHKNKNISFNRRSFLGTTAVSTAGMYLASQAPFSIAQDLRISEVGQTASTRHGRVRGLMRDGVQQFWGVPYGAPTDGENRFMPPKAPARWSGVRDAFQIGNRCYQGPNAFEPSPVVLAMNRLEQEGEDCLNLNVFTHAADRKSTRLNSSHITISYAVFCLKKKR